MSSIVSRLLLPEGGNQPCRWPRVKAVSHRFAVDFFGGSSSSDSSSPFELSLLASVVTVRLRAFKALKMEVLLRSAPREANHKHSRCPGGACTFCWRRIRNSRSSFLITVIAGVSPLSSTSNRSKELSRNKYHFLTLFSFLTPLHYPYGRNFSANSSLKARSGYLARLPFFLPSTGAFTSPSGTSSSRNSNRSLRDSILRESSSLIPFSTSA